VTRLPQGRQSRTRTPRSTDPLARGREAAISVKIDQKSPSTETWDTGRYRRQIPLLPSPHNAALKANGARDWVRLPMLHPQAGMPGQRAAPHGWEQLGDSLDPRLAEWPRPSLSRANGSPAAPGATGRAVSDSMGIVGPRERTCRYDQLDTGQAHCHVSVPPQQARSPTAPWACPPMAYVRVGRTPARAHRDRAAIQPNTVAAIAHAGGYTTSAASPPATKRGMVKTPLKCGALHMITQHGRRAAEREWSNNAE